MNKQFTVACIQNCAGLDIDVNLEESTDLVNAAQAKGADLVCLPEFFSCLEVTDRELRVGAFSEDQHPVIPHFSAVARDLGVWILLGSLAVKDDSQKVRNRSFLIDALGNIVARYDKLHMFDVDLSDGMSYRESDTLEAGDRAVVAPTPWGMVGLSVCYDLRFAYLYRALAQAGASCLTVPAAFTKTTGEAHWHVLLRSRAIETGCYVFAPCQYGRHGKAETYGHSLIVDPWGHVLADGGDGPGYVMADIELANVEKARKMIPALRHDRSFASPATIAVEGGSAQR